MLINGGLVPPPLEFTKEKFMIIREYSFGTLHKTELNNNFIKLQGCANMEIKEDRFNNLLKDLDCLQSLYTHYYNVDGLFDYGYNGFSYTKNSYTIHYTFKHHYSVHEVIMLKDNIIQSIDKFNTSQEAFNFLVGYDYSSMIITNNNFTLPESVLMYNTQVMDYRIVNGHLFTLNYSVISFNSLLAIVYNEVTEIKIKSKYLNEDYITNGDDILDKLFKMLSLISYIDSSKFKIEYIKIIDEYNFIINSRFRMSLELFVSNTLINVCDNNDNSKIEFNNLFNLWSYFNVM